MAAEIFVQPLFSFWWKSGGGWGGEAALSSMKGQRDKGRSVPIGGRRHKTDNADDVGLVTLVVDGVAHGFAIYGQTS